MKLELGGGGGAPKVKFFRLVLLDRPSLTLE